MRTSSIFFSLLATSLLGGVVACSAGSDDGGQADDLAVEGVDPQIVSAALANLKRISGEIDKDHVAKYSLPGDVADQFVRAVQVEFEKTPALLESRMRTLASMVFFSAPEVKTDPNVGKVTPFHGLDDAGFNALMASEDSVFNSHVSANGGSPNGVRPFSVCETKYFIKIAKGEITNQPFISNRSVTVSDINVYGNAYKAFSSDANNCSADDLAEWYNFRGLGGLRPTWLESNISERFVRRMVGACGKAKIETGMEQACKLFLQNRLGYRDTKNTELALREVYYDPSPTAMINGQTAESYMVNPQNSGVFVEDRNGDGIGEWIAPGPATIKAGALVSLSSLTLKTPTKVLLASKAKLLVGGVLKDYASGEAVTVSSLAASKIEYSTTALTLDASSSLRLPVGTSVTLSDGSIGTVPTTAQQTDAKKQYSVDIKVSEPITLPINSAVKPTIAIASGTSGVASQFTGDLQVRVTLQDGSTVGASIAPQYVEATQAIDTRFKHEMLGQADLGLLSVFKDSTNCTGSSLSLDTCPLLKRFSSLIDRHESFYQTYSALDQTTSQISQQPSPLVACSITLRASHQWDTAGTPKGGTAGFIFLMRIPFAQILVGDDRSIDTLGRLKGDLKQGPGVLKIQDIYAGKAKLDMSKVWLDIATLSHNQYSGEHEVSKYGSVPAEQIEGILVVRRPVAMGNGVTPPPAPTGSGTPFVDQEPGDTDAGVP